MTWAIFAAVLFAALLHASWNALVKGSSDKAVGMTAVTVGHAPLALLVIPFVPGIPMEAWPWCAASLFGHLGYQLFLMRAYDMGDYTQVYPIARGTGPALVTLVTLAFLDRPIAPVALAGIALVCAGIAGLALVRRGDGLRNPRAVGAALLTGCFIATYSLTDGMGAAVAGTALGYIAWMTLFNAIIFALFIGATQPATLARTLREGKVVFLVGGTASVLAYMIAVWAMMQTSIAQVSALRETSVAFALIIGALFLGERVTPAKAASVLVVLCGAVLIRFG